MWTELLEQHDVCDGTDTFNTVMIYNRACQQFTFSDPITSFTYVMTAHVLFESQNHLLAKANLNWPFWILQKMIAAIKVIVLKID